MSQPLFIQYPKCGTCQKAFKWLQKKNIEVDLRDIVAKNPTKNELSKWIEKSGLPAQKFFNTSGQRYRSLNLKEKVKTASKQELISLLASEGMLVKRPIIVGNDFVLVGFKEGEWSEKLG